MTQLIKPEMAARQLSQLLRRAVQAKTVPAAATPAMIVESTYCDAERQPIGTCASDLSFAAYAGAALSMIPADAAEECIGKRKLDETLQENFAEVLNVLACLFITESGRVTLTETAFAPAKSSAPPAAATKQALCFEIDIDGYGSGQITLRSLS